MILAAWVLVAALCCGVHSMAATVAMNEPPSGHESSSDEDSLPPPDKRILKYLLPSSQAWSGISDANMPIPTGQEGTKRGYSDRNFLRFGRGDAEKKDDGKNFLRFGRGDSDEYDDEIPETSEESLMSAEKRDRNFLRFGRDRNFLRFGRGGTEEFGHERTPMEFALGYDAVEDPILTEKRYQNFLRFGRGKNFLRFGRLHKDNFLRFGRSVDQQTACDDCSDDVNSHNPSIPASHLDEPEIDNSKHISPKEHGSVKNFQHSEVRKAEAVHRNKRAALSYYDYSAIPSHGPVPWAMNYQPASGSLEEEVVDSDMDGVQEVGKRSRNFLRFGRDRNFLRFGKRGDADDYSSPQSSGSELVMVSPAQYPRIVRAPTNNFLRFG